MSVPDPVRSPPEFIESDDGEFLAVLASSGEEAITKGAKFWLREPTSLRPVMVELVPIGGVPGCEAYWAFDVTALAADVLGELGEPGAVLTILGPPVTYWRCRGGC